MKLESFGDLFKYNKELFEDDFNAGQKVVIKAKSKSQDATSVSRYKPIHTLCFIRSSQQPTNKQSLILAVKARLLSKPRSKQL